MTPLFKRSLRAIAIIVGTFAAVHAQARSGECTEQRYRCETNYEQQCGYEQQCHSIPGERVCSQERVCETRYTSPTCENVEECGTNAFGEPLCKTHEVCSGGGNVEECGYVERCSDSGSRDECSNEYVCGTHPVQSCGYVTVPVQCSEPDPIYPTPVDPDPVYPTPVDPDPIDPTPIDPAPVDPSPIGMGPASVQNLRVTTNAAATLLTFKDLGQGLTYKTRYFISVSDMSGAVILNQYSSDKGQIQKITLNQTFSPKKRYKLVIRVQRTGGELATDVVFTKSIDF